MPTKLLFAGLASTILAACGTHSPSSDSTNAAHGAEDALAAEDDGVEPPKEYYDALYQQTLANLGKEGSLNLAGAKQVLWVNFNGATLNKGYDKGQSFILCRNSVSIPASTISAADQATILTKVADYYSAVNAALYITSKQPATGDYTTLHVGGTYASLGCSGSGVLGIAPLDRGNRQPNDIGFVFSGLNSSVYIMAATIAHEAGHTFGLSHVREQPDVMYPTVTSKITGFLAGSQNEPQLLQAALGQGKATLEGSTPAAPAAPTPTVTPAPAPAPAPTVATNPSPKPGTPSVPPTQVAGFPNIDLLKKLLESLGGLSPAGGLGPNILGSASAIFGLGNGSQSTADIIAALQMGGQVIVTGFDGEERLKLLNLLSTVAAGAYANQGATAH